MKGFYIEISNGLLTGGHRKRMGAAVWEFMWCLDRITKIEDEIGYVLGGKPIKLKEFSKDLESSERTISENLNHLKKEGYIDITRTGRGLIIKVSKAKKRFNQKLISDKKKTSDQTTENFRSNIIVLRQDSRQDNKTITKVIEKSPSYGNVDINLLQEYFKIKMQIPEEDCTQKQSRQYWSLLLRKSKKGIEGVKWLVDIAAQDNFYRHNISSSKKLYFNRTNLIQRRRGNISGKGGGIDGEAILKKMANGHGEGAISFDG